MKSAAQLIVAIVLTGLTLAACGGGSSAPSRVVSPPAPPAPPPPPSSDASLSALRLSTGELDQVFQASVNDYSATTSYLGSSTTIVATASDENASVSINGSADVTGEAREAMAIANGANVVTVTVTAEDGVTSDSYSIDVARADAAGLSHLAYMKASNTGMGDRFGSAVAYAGNTVAIAAAAEDSAALVVNGDGLDDSAADSGAVYAFQLDDAGTWIEEAYIKASNSDAGHAFGHAIALSGNTLAVSANREDSAATGVGGDETDDSAVDSGAVYVFVRDETGAWSQQAYIKASNTEALDNFGASIALDGDTLAVGADLEDGASLGMDGDQADNNAADAGAVYVFTRDVDAAWTQQAYIKASNTDAGDRFGGALALSGNTLVVGAPGESSRADGIDGNQDSNNLSGAGAAYVFVRDGAGAWSQQAYVKASNSDGEDDFGAALSLDGDTLVVGAPREDSAAVGIDGFENDNRSLNSGAAYVFVRDGGGSWSQAAYLKASNTGSQDRFGRAVAAYGDFVAVGALEDSSASGANGDQADNLAPSAGAVYLFARDPDGAWTQSSYIKAINTGSNDGFGESLSIADAGLLIGADLEDSSAAGIGGDMMDDAAPDAGAVYLIQ